MQSSSGSPLGSSIEASEIAAGAVSGAKLAEDATDGIQVHVDLSAESAVGQGTWTMGIDSAGLYCFQLNNATGVADGDNISFSVFLPIGTYTIVTRYFALGNGGVVDYDLNGTEVHSIDSYVGSTAQNKEDVKTSVSVTVEGKQTFKMRVDGKNASSTSYVWYVNSVTFIRTGA